MLKWLVNRGRLTAEQAEQLQQARPGVTAEKLLYHMFPASGDMELTIADDDDREEDTKDLLPDEDLDPKQLTLPPRGSPAFAGGVAPAQAGVTFHRTADRARRLGENDRTYRRRRLL